MKNLNLFILTAATLFSFAPAAMANDDSDFVTKASVSNKFEIESSKLALEKSQNAEVKSFAQKMIDDHTKAGNDLKAALAKSGIDKAAMKDTLDSGHQAVMNDLQKQSGAEFDEEYVDEQEDAHDEAVALFESYAKNGKNPALKDFAAKTLPTLKMHQDHVSTLDEKLD